MKVFRFLEKAAVEGAKVSMKDIKACDEFLKASGGELVRRKNQHRSDYVFDDNTALTIRHTLGEVVAWYWDTEKDEWVQIDEERETA
jgi:hypothetical protein